MKKLDIGLVILAGLLILLGIIVYIGSKSTTSEVAKDTWANKPLILRKSIAPRVPNGYMPPIELPIRDLKYIDQGAGNSQLAGTVTNTDKVTRSIIFTVTYYGPDRLWNKEGCTAAHRVLNTGETANFAIKTPANIKNFATFEVHANGF